MNPAHANGNGYATPLDEDRLPPQNIEAEESVLGSILLDNEVLHDIVPLLKPSDFYRGSHQTIYRAILELYEHRKAIDAITLADELIRTGHHQAIGGDETLARILDSVPHAANAKYHAQIVRQKSVTRQLIEGANETLRDGYSNNFTAEQLLESAEKRVFEIADEEATGDVALLGETLPGTMDMIERRHEHGEIEGVGTGFPDLDDLMGGLRSPHLIIVGARPSMGKTALALQIADYASTDLKITSMIISLEMGRDDLAERLLCARGRVDNHKVRSGQGITSRDRAELGRAYQQLRESLILIDDSPSRSMLQIFAAARRAKLRNNLGLLIVDYIQLVDTGDTRDSRQEQIAKISRRLKALAREIKVPVIALSQLNRGVETREDRRPRMADLRESGAIEQDADLVLLLHRPEYYDPNDQPGVAEVIVGKNRHGATGTVRLTFLRNTGRFESLAPMAQPIEAFDKPY